MARQWTIQYRACTESGAFEWLELETWFSEAEAVSAMAEYESVETESGWYRIVSETLEEAQSRIAAMVDADELAEAKAYAAANDSDYGSDQWIIDACDIADLESAGLWAPLGDDDDDDDAADDSVSDGPDFVSDTLPYDWREVD